LALLIRVDADALEGRLDLRGPGLEPLVRAARGKTCDEVADALALILAMALDPTVTPNAPAAGAPTAPPSVQTPAAEPARAPVASAAPVPTLPPPRSPRQARPRAFAVDIGAGPAVAAGMAPAPSVGGVLFLEASAKGPGLWAPAVVVAAELDHSPTTHPNGAYGSFTRVFARLEGCPLRFPQWPTLGLRPCGAFEYGMLEGKGEIVRRGRWVAPAVGLRAEWRPYPTVLLALDGLVSWPLVRDRFFFAPRTTVLKVPARAGGATLAVAATLP
jgi:hypothetical protein